MRAFAVSPDESRGRRYPEDTHPYRNPYERDRDRIVHSRAFRRLEDKTQVFTERFSDHFRNRLTHTIEVAQISRTIADHMGLNEDLVEALALVHDIGHPPFGHSGERTLDQMMQAFGDHFDHNLHALRIVESFEQRYADFPGLNLTFEVREGIIKHSRDYAPDKHPELSEYLLDKKPPLEAQIIDLADEIAYYIADLDDGFEAKLLSLDTLRREIPLFERFFEPVQRRYPNAAPKLQFNETLKRMLDHLVTDLMEHSLAEMERLGIKSVEDVRSQLRRLITASEEATRDKAVLKKFLYQNLYQHAAFSAEREQGTRVVESLFQFYLDHPEKMPAWYAMLAAEGRKHRVVCDYIAGMTDHYIQRLHREFVGCGKAENPSPDARTSEP